MFGKKNKKSKLDEEKLRLKEKKQRNLPGANLNKRLAELEAEVALEEKNSINDSKNEKSNNKSNITTFWIVLICTVLLSKLPFSDLLFTPLNQFATMIHEMSHAIMCVLTGGSVSGMTIVSDGHGHGGLTMCHGGIPFIHVQAGYLGTALFGCLLVFLGQYKHLAKSTLKTLGIITACGALLFMGAGLLVSPFLQVLMSIIWAGLLSFALFFLGRKLDEKQANFALLFLAFHISMDSIRSVGIVITSIVFSTGIISDATIMQKYYLLPSIFWSLLWAIISISLVGITFWYSYMHDNQKT